MPFKPNIYTQVKDIDPSRIQQLTTKTGFFSKEEINVATEVATERLMRGIESGYEFILAEMDGKLVGYSCFGRVPTTLDRYDLYWLAVDPDLQGQGLGKTLLDYTEDAISKLHGKLLFVDTSGREQYEPTHAFYKHNGYQLVATVPAYYRDDDDKLIFCKKL